MYGNGRFKFSVTRKVEGEEKVTLNRSVSCLNSVLVELEVDAPKVGVDPNKANWKQIDRDMTEGGKYVFWVTDITNADGKLVTYRATGTREDMVSIKAIDGSTVHISYEELVKGIEQASQSSNPREMPLPFNQMHSTIIANHIRNLHSFVVQNRTTDGRIPEWFRKEDNFTPFV